MMKIKIKIAKMKKKRPVKSPTGKRHQKSLRQRKKPKTIK